MSSGGESSMVSDFAMSEMSGMSGIQADAAEVDPISEADVYLAYGRHQQAEDILKEALEATPDRHEIKLKLLEVYFAAKDRESFEQGAQELHEALGDESDPIWAKTVTMGAQLCPGNELFGGTSAESLQEELAGGVEDNDEDLLDFDFDLDSTDMEAPAATETAEDTGLDFDLDAEMAATEAPAEEPVVAAAAEESSADNGLDFDVSSLDFNLDEGGAAEATDTAEAVAEEEGGLDFDLEGLGSGTAESEAAAEEPALDMGDLSMEEPAAAESAETESLGDLGDELGDDAFGEVDEVGTKLDLAKAYVDMGDGDGARSILDEVLEEGDDAQKQQAQELLAQIG
jgi:pilus assembly protein FimV